MNKKIILEYEAESDFKEVLQGLEDQVRVAGAPIMIFKTPDGDILVKIPKEIKNEK